MDLFTHLVKLKNEKTRVILTIVCIALAVCITAVLLAFGNTIKESTLTLLAAEGLESITLSGGYVSHQGSGASLNTAVPLNLMDDAIVKKNPHVQYSSPIYDDETTVEHKGKPIDLTLKGVNEFYFQVLPYKKIAGRFINAIDEKEQKAVAFIDNNLAKVLLGDADASIGESIIINEKSFRVIGVTDHVSYGDDGISYTAWIPSSTFIEMYRDKTLSAIAFMPIAGIDHKAIIKEIRKEIALEKKLDPSDESLITVSDFASILNKATLFFNALLFLLMMIGSIMIFISNLSLMSIIYASIQNDSQEIGIRMALGEKRKMILRYYLFEAITMSILSLILGLLLFFLISGLLKSLAIQLAFLNNTPLLLSFSLPIFLFMSIATILISLLAAYIPAKNILQLSPMKALGLAI